MDYVSRQQFDYNEACFDEDNLIIHSEFVLKDLPYSMQINETCFKKTFTNIYYWLLNQDNHPAKQLDDLFFEEYVYRCTEIAFNNISHKNLINELKEKIKKIY
tara:strand:+ start:109 stop:417 length:309 start_codon:yes stop_codon:yes gene_type:complete